MYEPEIADILNKVIRPRHVCLEIGACCGEHTLQLSELAKNGKIISAEPLASNIHQLKKLTLTNVSIVEAAVSDFVGKADLFFGRGGSNFEFNLRGEDVNGNKTAPHCEVEVITVDGLLKGSRCDVMLIDVEGHAGKVLKGASQTIRTYQPCLVLEVHDDGEWKEIQDSVDYKFYDLDLKEITERRYFTLGVPLSDPIDDLVLSSHEHAKYDVIHEKYEAPNYRQIEFLSSDKHEFCKLWRELIDSSDKILEIGIGSSETLQWLYHRGCDFSAIDISGIAVENSKKTFPNHDIRRSNALKLPYDNDSFFMVQHLDGMEHIPSKWELSCLKEALRVSNKYVLYSNACGDAYLDHFAIQEGYDAVHVNIKNGDGWNEFYTKHEILGYKTIFSDDSDHTYYTVLEKHENVLA